MQARSHNIQGIGTGFIPKVLDTEIIDEVITVTDEQAFETSRRLNNLERILCGVSSEAAIWAVMSLAERTENRGKNIVMILSDIGE